MDIIAAIIRTVQSGTMCPLLCAPERVRSQVIQPMTDTDERYRQLYEQARDAILLVSLDGRILEANAAAEAMYGLSREQLTQRRISDLRSPDTRAEIGQQMAQAGRDGILFETLHRRADGSPFPVEVSSRGVTLNGESYLISVIRDLTERRAVDLQLRETEERYHILLETAPDGVFVQTGGCFQYLNAAALELFGASDPVELVGKPVVGQFAPSCREFVAAQLHRLNSLRESIPPTELTLLQVTGDELPVEMRAAPLTWDGQPGALVFMHDVRRRLADRQERDQLIEQLTQAQKMESIGRLAAGVAHDFNNLLTVIMGFTELARSEMLPGQTSLEEALQEVHRAADRARDLTRHLLAFARRQELNLQPVDMAQLLSAVQRMLERMVGERIRIDLTVASDAGVVFGDPSQLEQVLINLVVNARDAMNGAGVISIDSKSIHLDRIEARSVQTLSGWYVVVSVSDTGCGMDAQTVARIFDPFYTTKPQGAGTGLGLSTAYGIVAQHRGCITVYSEPGIGSTFRVYLPRAGTPNDTQDPPIPSTVVRYPDSVVLLAEDDPNVRRVAVSILQQLGYQPHVAADAEEALTIAGRLPAIDVLLTDLVMPGLSGVELYKALEKRHPDMAVVYMTGYAREGLAIDLQLSDRARLVEKPFSVESLSRAIDAALHAVRSAKPI